MTAQPLGIRDAGIQKAAAFMKKAHGSNAALIARKWAWQGDPRWDLVADAIEAEDREVTK